MPYRFNPLSGNLEYCEDLSSANSQDYHAGYYNIPFGIIVLIEQNKISIFSSHYKRSGYIKRSGFKKRTA
tara:strand:- start:107 stop:316 length:210 start_codon:yes stop_codon:yes gene_type:complete